ncbi:MAG: DUF2155 domain-containing protein [Alphaproteobacteria bacterium]|nr:DUF2155 domain-containing protein [Alphaproteobacteria bacterium]
MLKTLSTIAIFAAALFTFSNNASATYIDKNEVVLRALDKITGRVSVIKTQVGTQATFGSLDIHVKACKTRPPEEKPENSAFLKIHEIKQGENERLIFSGWMFSSSPALSAIEHPVYDIWVIKCQDSTQENNDGTKKLIEQNSVQIPKIKTKKIPTAQ